MQKNSEAHQYILPVTVEGKDFTDFMLPADYTSTGVKALFTTKNLYCNPRDQLEASIMKLFKVAFDIDLKTCTKKEWAARITIKGGALKQWQSFIKLPQKGGVRNHE